MARPRFRTIAVASVVLAGAAAGGWMVARSDRWTPPIRRAERAIDAGDLVGAGKILGEVIRDDPRQPRARLLYARLLRLQGRPRDADAALARAMDLGAPEAELWREYGLLLADSDFVKAEPILLRALKVHPDDVEILRALVDGLSRQGRSAEAAEFASRWLRLEPGRPAPLMARSRALVQAGRAREAAADLRAALDRRPDDFETRLLLADCYLADADTKAAEPELERCRRLRPDRPEPLVGLAACAVEQDDLDRARDLLDRAIALDPSSLLTLIARGDLELKARRYDRALADFERVVGLDPGNKRAHLHLARLCRAAGDPGRAAEHERAYRAIEAEQVERSRAVRGMR